MCRTPLCLFLPAIASPFVQLGLCAPKLVLSRIVRIVTPTVLTTKPAGTDIPYRTSVYV